MLCTTKCSSFESTQHPAQVRFRVRSIMEQTNSELNAFGVAMSSVAKFIDDKFDAFVKSLSQQSGSRVEQVVRKTIRET